jgi:hypothetical protein
LKDRPCGELLNDPNFDSTATPLSKLPINTRYLDVITDTISADHRRVQSLVVAQAVSELAAWLGQSTDVAKKRYWQVTEIDLAKAVQNPVQNVP